MRAGQAILSIVFVCLGWCYAGSSAGQPAARVDLAFGLKQGESVRYRITRLSVGVVSSNQSAVGKPEQLFEQRLEQDSLVSLHVIKESEQGKTIELRFEQVKVEQSLGQRVTVRFDSTHRDAKDSTEAAELVRAILSTPILIELDHRGRMVQIKGARIKLPEDATIAAAFEQLMLKRHIRATYEPMLCNMKPAPVTAVGETWVSQQIEDASPFGELKLKVRQTLKSVKNDQAIVMISGKAELDSSLSGLDHTVELKSFSLTGKTVWDVGQRGQGGMAGRGARGGRGVVIEHQQSIEPVLEGAYQGSQIRIKTTTEIRITRVDE